jgi:hypothetical protein
MIRLGTLFWLLLVSTTGFAMYGVKYQVQALEDELARAKRATIAEEHEIRVLDAEWAYLTRPETLEEMNRRFQSLAPMETKQLHMSAADIPLRAPAPSPPVETPADVVAEVPPQSVLPVTPGAPAMPAVPEKQAAAPQPAKPMPVKVVAKPSAPRRAKSLDDLISQIMASR